jgi:hypothetical protein
LGDFICAKLRVMTANNSIRFTQVPGLEVHESEDGLIIFNAQTDRVHHLNPTAGVLFELCRKPASCAMLLESLRELYVGEDISADVIQTGIDNLLEEKVLAPLDGD